jgi:hypothetical protein
MWKRQAQIDAAHHPEWTNSSSFLAFTLRSLTLTVPMVLAINLYAGAGRLYGI